MARRVVGPIAAAVFLCVATVTGASIGSGPPDAAERVEFTAFLDKVRQAHVEYVQSRPEAFKALKLTRPGVARSLAA
jgi:hypothetical protein